MRMILAPSCAMQYIKNERYQPEIGDPARGQLLPQWYNIVKFSHTSSLNRSSIFRSHQNLIVGALRICCIEKELYADFVGAYGFLPWQQYVFLVYVHNMSSQFMFRKDLLYLQCHVVNWKVPDGCGRLHIYTEDYALWSLREEQCMVYVIVDRCKERNDGTFRTPII